MNTHNSAGIDYGRGMSNIDNETGIRFGIIHQNSLNLDMVSNEMESHYPEPCYAEDINCPRCGKFFRVTPNHKWGDAVRCYSCQHQFELDMPEFMEPSHSTYEKEEYNVYQVYDEYNLRVTKSPYYTLANFCSPCYPGAGDLDTPNPKGVKTYCLGHEWFEQDFAPYPVFRVEDDMLVDPPRPDGFDEFLEAYIECALWSSTDEDGRHLERYNDESDLADETWAQFKEDCHRFLYDFGHLVKEDFARAGHDFWLTRNGHGAGFWDGDWPEDAGKRLTESSKLFGNCDLYVGDDGKIYSA
jgi:hypothetical protein